MTLTSTDISATGPKELTYSEIYALNQELRLHDESHKHKFKPATAPAIATCDYNFHRTINLAYINH